MDFPDEIIEHILSFNRFHRTEFSNVLNQLKYLTDEYNKEFNTKNCCGTTISELSNQNITNYHIDDVNDETIRMVISEEIFQVINQQFENNMRRYIISRKPISSVSDYILEKNNQKMRTYNNIL